MTTDIKQVRKTGASQKQDTTHKKYAFDYLVFIGRFQPFHLGHHKVVASALQQARRVIVLVGSAKQPRSMRNPWSFAERESFIRSGFEAEKQERIIVSPLLDDTYNEENWLSRVQHSVQGITVQFPPQIGNKSPKIGLIGHNKDHSSYYLSLFPQWTSVNVKSEGLSATPLRESYFLEAKISDHFSAGMKQQLLAFQKTVHFQEVATAWRFIQDYKKGWENAPYAPTFITVDAVVVQSGHVLMVERKAHPGKGLWALPGGFIGTDEKLQDAMIRELREETKIKVPAPVLAGSIKAKRVFDDPHRSDRGRTITHAFLIKLKPDAKGLPKVKGGDDAAHAKWVALADLSPEQLFEDHFHIINALLD